MKYIAVLQTNGIGGVWSVVRESLIKLKKYYEVFLLIYVRNSDLREEVNQFVEENCIEYKIIDIHASNGLAFDLKRFLYIDKIDSIIGDAPAIIHSHDSFTSCAYLPFLYRENRYLFCTFHGTLVKGRTIKSRIQFWINKYLRIEMLKRSHIHFISCDPLSIPTLNSYFKNTIDIKLAINGVTGFNIAHERNSKRFIVGYIPRFHPLKNWHIVAESVALLNKKGLKVSVLFAGAGECYEDVKTWCEHHTDISYFMGYCSNVKNEIIPKIDLHVLPSEYPEGIPMIILECMAAGIPSIVSNTGSCSFAVQHGKTGYVVKPNVLSVSFAIERLICDETLYNQLRKNCLEDWKNRFSSDAMARSYKKIFDSYI